MQTFFLTVDCPQQVDIHVYIILQPEDCELVIMLEMYLHDVEEKQGPVKGKYNVVFFTLEMLLENKKWEEDA